MMMIGNFRCSLKQLTTYTHTQSLATFGRPYTAIGRFSDIMVIWSDKAT